MIRLTKRSLLILMVGSPLWLVGPSLAGFYILVITVLLLTDFAFLPRKSKITIKRILPLHFVVDTPSQIGWEVSIGKGILQDSFPDKEYRIQVDSTQIMETFLPTERGQYDLEAFSLTLKGLLGLIDRDYFFHFTEQIKVYPNSRSSKKLFDICGKPNLNKSNNHKIYQRGGEFESLRPYIYGEDLRNVEWKISAKRGEMTCKNWEIQNDRHISVLIDCGRKTAEVIGEHSLLDHSLNATAQLCQLIQSKQDTFTLYAFSNKIEAAVPKTDRKTMMRNTLESIYQLKSQPVESDYWHVVGQVMHQLNKRSLIIFFSNVLDTCESLGLINNLVRASSKHLVLCVIMRDKKLEEAVDTQDLYQQAAACHLLLEKKRAIKHMRAKGIHVLEANAENYINEVIQTYLRIREKV